MKNKTNIYFSYNAQVLLYLCIILLYSCKSKIKEMPVSSLITDSLSYERPSADEGFMFKNATGSLMYWDRENHKIFTMINIDNKYQKEDSILLPKEFVMINPCIYSFNQATYFVDIKNTIWKISKEGLNNTGNTYNYPYSSKFQFYSFDGNIAQIIEDTILISLSYEHNPLVYSEVKNESSLFARYKLYDDSVSFIDTFCTWNLIETQRQLNHMKFAFDPKTRDIYYIYSLEDTLYKYSLDKKELVFKKHMNNKHYKKPNYKNPINNFRYVNLFLSPLSKNLLVFSYEMTKTEEGILQTGIILDNKGNIKSYLDIDKVMWMLIYNNKDEVWRLAEPTSFQDAQKSEKKYYKLDF